MMRVAPQMDENLRGRFFENLVMLIIFLLISLLTILNSPLA